MELLVTHYFADPFRRPNEGLFVVRVHCFRSATSSNKAFETPQELWFLDWATDPGVRHGSNYRSTIIYRPSLLSLLSHDTLGGVHNQLQLPGKGFFLQFALSEGCLVEGLSRPWLETFDIRGMSW